MLQRLFFFFHCPRPLEIIISLYPTPFAHLFVFFFLSYVRVWKKRLFQEWKVAVSGFGSDVSTMLSWADPISKELGRDAVSSLRLCLLGGALRCESSSFLKLLRPRLLSTADSSTILSCISAYVKHSRHPCIEDLLFLVPQLGMLFWF